MFRGSFEDNKVYKGPNLKVLQALGLAFSQSGQMIISRAVDDKGEAIAGILIFCHSDAENHRKSGSESRNKWFRTQRNDPRGRPTDYLHFNRGGGSAGLKINVTGTTFCVKSQYFPLQIRLDTALQVNF